MGPGDAVVLRLMKHAQSSALEFRAARGGEADSRPSAMPNIRYGLIRRLRGLLRDNLPSDQDYPSPAALAEAEFRARAIEHRWRPEPWASFKIGAGADDLIVGIAEVIEEVTGIEPSEVTPDMSFIDDLGIDALSMVEIAVRAEDIYGLKISDDDLVRLRTVGDLVLCIQEIAAANRDAATSIWTEADARGD